MKSFFEWFAERHDSEQPWLIFGKGPSFEKRQQYDLRSYHLLGLNHVIREQRCEVAHMIDLDVVDKLGSELATAAAFVVMPWMPHVGNAPGKKTLAQLVKEHVILGQLDRAGQLLWYNLATAWEAVAGSPVVPVQYFSAEAAIALLATAGVREIRSLGIDGGASYAKNFSDLNGSESE